METTTTTRAALTPEKRVELKKACGQMLRNSGFKPNTKQGAVAVHAFWVGALEAMGLTNDAYVFICLLAGRHSELVDMTEAAK